MIEIIQAGQFGKTDSLVEMHRLRKIIFKDRMGWDVNISQEGLEVDDYDLPETIYILVRDEKKRVVGTWRMLPSNSPSMVRNIWPEFLRGFPIPTTPNVWETSRFGVHSYASDKTDYVKHVNMTTVKLIWALTKTCLLCGITDIYTMYNLQVGRSVRRIGFIPEEVSEIRDIEGNKSVVGRFKMDEAALRRIEYLTAFTDKLDEESLPPGLHNFILPSSYQKGRYSYA